MMTTLQIQTVRPLAPEDVRPGDVVVVLFEIDQMITRLGETSELCGTPVYRLVRVRSMPVFVRALRVLEVSLPMVLVEDTEGDELLIDVRLKELGRLPETTGARAMRGLDERRKKEAAESAAAAARSGPSACGCAGETVPPREGSD